MKKAFWTIVLIAVAVVAVSVITAIFGGWIGILALAIVVAELFLFGIKWWKAEGSKAKKAIRRIGFILIAWVSYAVSYGIIYLVYKLLMKLF